MNYYITLFTIENPLSSKRGKFPLRQNVKVLKCSHFLLIQASPFSLRRAIPQSQILILFPLSVEGHNRGLSNSIKNIHSITQMLLYSFLSPCSAQCLGTSYRSQLFLILTSYFVAHRKRVSAKPVPDFVSSYFRNFCCISQVVLAPNSAPPRSQISFALTSFYSITFSNMHHFWPWQPKHIEHLFAVK